MTEIRPARAADAPRLTGLLAQLGYPSELDAVTSRLASIQNSASQQVLVAVAADESRIDGYIEVGRRRALEEDERIEITGLVVDSAARRSGLGRTLVNAAEQWALQHGLRTVVVRSNVVRPQSHPFYEGIGYQRTTTSHTYRKEVRACLVDPADVVRPRLATAPPPVPHTASAVSRSRRRGDNHGEGRRDGTTRRRRRRPLGRAYRAHDELRRRAAPAGSHG